MRRLSPVGILILNKDSCKDNKLTDDNFKVISVDLVSKRVMVSHGYLHAMTKQR